MTEEPIRIRFVFMDGHDKRMTINRSFKDVDGKLRTREVTRIWVDGKVYEERKAE